MAEDGRFQSRQSAAQAGRPGGAGPAPAGGGLSPCAFSLHTRFCVFYVTLIRLIGHHHGALMHKQ